MKKEDKDVYDRLEEINQMSKGILLNLLLTRRITEADQVVTGPSMKANLLITERLQAFGRDADALQQMPVSELDALCKQVLTRELFPKKETVVFPS